MVTFSPKKIHLLTISNNNEVHQNLRIKMDGHILNEVSEHKHLGVYITRNLDMSKHLMYLRNSVKKKLDMLRQLKFKLNRRSLEIIYMSFIRPNLEYGDVLFSMALKNHEIYLTRYNMHYCYL